MPGEFHLASCDGCGLVYQNPRVRVDQLGLMYPDHYGPHSREPELSRILRERGPSARWVLSRWLGYPAVRTEDVRAVDRARARWHARRFQDEFPPWRGEGRLLDVGCASGRFLRQMSEIGWTVAGVEFDAAAARKARTVTSEIFEGDPMDAPFAPGRFDVVTAFHVIEHLPDPLGTLRRMLEWLAPGGLVIVEVPNVAGVGGRLFGRYWSGAISAARHASQLRTCGRWWSARGDGWWRPGTAASRATSSGACITCSPTGPAAPPPPGARWWTAVWARAR